MTKHRKLGASPPTDGQGLSNGDFFRDLTETLDLVLYIATHDLGRILYVSPAYEELWGRTCRSLYEDPSSWVEAIDPDDRETTLRVVREGIAAGSYSVEYRITRPGRGERWIHDQGFLIREDNLGQPARIAGSAKDITERKKLEQDLATQARQLNQVSDAIIAYDRDLHIVSWNAGAERMYGWKAAEVMGRYYRDVVRSEMTPEELKQAMAMLVEKGQYSGRFLHHARDGRALHVEGSAMVVKDDASHITGFVSASRDATEKKRVEDSLRESERRYRLMAENTIDVVYQVDVSGAVGYASPSVRQLIGYEAAEVVGRHFADFIEPADLAIARERFQSNLRGEVIRGTLLRLIHKDGHAVICETTGSPILENGVVVGVQGTARDVSDRVRAEQSLRESERRYRELFEGNPHPMFVYDLETLRYLAVNDAAVQAYGYSREEFLGMTIKNIRPAEDHARLMSNVKKARKKGGLDKAGVWRHRLRDGSIRLVEITSHTLEFEGRPAELVLAHDVTEQQRVEQALRVSQQELELRVKQRTSDLERANIALRREASKNRQLEGQVLEAGDQEQRRIGQDLHDGICQMLTAVAFLCDSLRQRLTKASPADAERAGRIKELVDRAIAESRRVARGLHPVQLEEIGLMAALRDLAESVGSIFNIRCTLVCAREVPIPDMTMATHLYRIAQEAVSNAHRHGRAAEIRISLGRLKSGHVRLTIEDDGVGIPGERGNGMGLAVMEYRAAAIGASLDITTSKGQGTRIVCTAPLALKKRRGVKPERKDPGRRRTKTALHVLKDVVRLKA